MRRLLRLSRLHWCIVFMLAGAFAAAFAFSTYNLFHLTMANLGFLQKYGLIAVQEGALVQTFGVMVGGSFALVCFLGFKVCETELVMRFHRWTHGDE